MPDVTRRRVIELSAMSMLSSTAAAADAPRIAVIGAGAFGGWTALHLRRMGADVTLIDAWGPGNSRASSGGETRVIRCVYGSNEIYVEWVARALELWRENQRQWPVPVFHEVGALWLVSGDDSFVRGSIPVARRLGLSVDPLELADARRRYPQIDFDGVSKVYFEAQAGFLKAREACHAVRDQLVREGGRYVQALATPGDLAGQLDKLSLANGETVAADQFVFACGPWLGRLFPGVVGKSIHPTRQEVFYFGAPAGDTRFDPENFPVWLGSDERAFYGFPNVDRRGLKIADDTRGPDFDPSEGDRRPTSEGAENARRFLGRRFPALRDAPLLEARVCQYENSPDHDLIIDRHPEAPNVWLVGGGSGHGFKLGPAVGEHVAGCVLGRVEPIAKFSIARLAGLEASEKTLFDV